MAHLFPSFGISCAAADAEVGIGAGTRPVEPGHEVSDEGRRMPKRDYETSVQDEQIFVSVLANEDFTLVSVNVDRVWACSTPDQMPQRTLWQEQSDLR
eukprot:gene8755-10375_t